jgi:hypothetical protein
MSLSKLESLPNEILIDILEKYIDGMDILNAFAFQLNRRFDALIARCQRFRFDFMRCHKDDFRFCIGLLPAYIDKIGELALSEQNTPGQIHAFLSFFPSFDLFKRLRKLYLHINTNAVEPTVIENALLSLSRTTLDTLSVKITKVQNISSFDYAIIEIFRMKTLKRFSISCDSHRMNWSSLNEASSNIEYLSIYGINCELQALQDIFQCAPGLKYLNIQMLGIIYYNRLNRKSSSKNTITRMPMLHTVIFDMLGNGLESYTDLEPYFRSMPSLHHLEIKTHNDLSDVIVWEMLLKTSLRKLTYFNLENNVSSLKIGGINNIFESIQTPFWIEKRNFNIIIKELDRYGVDQRGLGDLQNFRQYDSNKPVFRWRIEPQRKRTDNLFAINEISSLSLSTESSSLLQDHYLDNVKHLVVHGFNENLFELLTTHVNCSQIKHLDLSFLKQEKLGISSLWTRIRNITSLRIKLYQLLDPQFASLNECNGLRFLDISIDRHSFDEKTISIIANMFPKLQHLTINTEDLQNVRLLQTYLPGLRSLTFASVKLSNFSLNDDYEQKMLDVNLRRQTEFLFQRGANWYTVWIDRAALQESYWESTAISSQRSTDYLMDQDSDD